MRGSAFEERTSVSDERTETLSERCCCSAWRTIAPAAPAMKGACGGKMRLMCSKAVGKVRQQQEGEVYVEAQEARTG